MTGPARNSGVFFPSTSMFPDFTSSWVSRGKKKLTLSLRASHWVLIVFKEWSSRCNVHTSPPLPLGDHYHLATKTKPLALKIFYESPGTEINDKFIDLIRFCGCPFEFSIRGLLCARFETKPSHGLADGRVNSEIIGSTQSNFWQLWLMPDHFLLPDPSNEITFFHFHPSTKSIRGAPVVWNQKLIIQDSGATKWIKTRHTNPQG